MKNLTHANMINEMLRQVAIGFDSTLSNALSVNQQTFPKYNIIKDTDEKYRLVLALAGYSQDDIEIQQKDKFLEISHTKTEESSKKEDEVEYYHKGISTKGFSFKMALAEHVNVKSAEMKDGLLTLHLELEIPEEKKPRRIEISK